MTNRVTNYNKIVSMSIEELAHWLDKHGLFEESPWMSWFNTKYCNNCESVIVLKEKSLETLGFNTYHDAECAYCEVNKDCRFFPGTEVPSTEEIIKMWLKEDFNNDL